MITTIVVVFCFFSLTGVPIAFALGLAGMAGILVGGFPMVQYCCSVKAWRSSTGVASAVAKVSTRSSLRSSFCTYAQITRAACSRPIKLSISTTRSSIWSPSRSSSTR